VTPLRWGFKTEANAIAREIRHDLGVKLIDPLDPWALADHLGIPLIALSTLRNDAPSAVAHFSRAERGAFSAMTVFYGSRRVIVYNDAHTRGRQASDITHELSHALLQHPPSPALDHRGCRKWNRDLEDEADWLAGVLLISEEAALEIVRTGMTVDVAVISYGVSKAMVQWRLNMTGARERVSLSKQDLSSQRRRKRPGK
jgi:Zn-dependent peptidase ImmA (M78 family)